MASRRRRKPQSVNENGEPVGEVAAEAAPEAPTPEPEATQPEQPSLPETKSRPLDTERPKTVSAALGFTAEVAEKTFTYTYDATREDLTSAHARIKARFIQELNHWLMDTREKVYAERSEFVRKQAEEGKRRFTEG